MKFFLEVGDISLFSPNKVMEQIPLEAFPKSEYAWQPNFLLWKDDSAGNANIIWFLQGI